MSFFDKYGAMAVMTLDGEDWSVLEVMSGRLVYLDGEPQQGLSEEEAYRVRDLFDPNTGLPWGTDMTNVVSFTEKHYELRRDWYIAI